MGQRNSKQVSLLGSKGSRDDGCIGNRKVRTIALSTILIAFFAMAASYLVSSAEWWEDQNIQAPVLGDMCQPCLDTANAYYTAVAGLAVVIVSAVMAILLFFVNCDDKCGRVAGVGLIIGGMMYMIGWLWRINIYNKALKDEIIGDTAPWDLLSDDDKQRVNAMLASWFGEALLPSATAILLGIDVFVHLFDDEASRLASNFACLCVVAFMTCPVYYIMAQDSDDSNDASQYIPINSDAYGWIATGYAVVFWFALLYVILYICTCCTCDCKDTRCVRVIMALGLILGGILTSIGYYIYAGDFTSDRSSDVSSQTVFYIGYTVLIGGVCIVWALDVGLDDFRGR